jgi:hypothetical protein
MTDEIDTTASTMSVFDASKAQVDKKDAHVDLNDPDHKTLVVSLDTSKVKNGIYTVKWHTVTPDDGGITDGTFQFNVGSAPVTPQPTVENIQAATATPSGATQVATATTAATAVATTASAATATTAAPTNAPTTGATVAASPTTAPPTTVPTTGAAENNTWLYVVVLGLLMVFAGIGLAVKVRR